MPLQDTIDRVADLIAAGGPREPGESAYGWPDEVQRILVDAVAADPAATLELGFRLGYAVAQRDARARAAKD